MTGIMELINSRVWDIILGDSNAHTLPILMHDWNEEEIKYIDLKPSLNTSKNNEFGMTKNYHIRCFISQISCQITSWNTLHVSFPMHECNIYTLFFFKGRKKSVTVNFSGEGSKKWHLIHFW